jgi:hypothetical protein
MRSLSAVLVTAVALLVPVAARAQDPQAVKSGESLLFILKLQDPETKAFKVTADGKPSVRACNGAVKVLKTVWGMDTFPNKDKVAAFVLSCYDPQTGGISDAPGGKADVASTSVGVMAAVELGIPREKFAKAMGYLKANAKTFDDVRIAVAAVEAWGVKDCPFDLTPWLDTAKEFGLQKCLDPKNGGARTVGSIAAMQLRLGKSVEVPVDALQFLRDGQRNDGGWGKAGDAASDAETTYRVMRAFMLMKEKPRDPAKLREFVAKCRNADGGYGVKPGEPSTMSGVYYAGMISHWLGGSEKK